jgi:hypothetical protein
MNAGRVLQADTRADDLFRMGTKLHQYFEMLGWGEVMRREIRSGSSTDGLAVAPAWASLRGMGGEGS